MIQYSVDTSACVALLNGSPTLRATVAKALGEGSVLSVSTIALPELWFDAETSARPEQKSARIEAFLAGPVHIMPFDEADARMAGDVRARLRRAGTPLGAYDAMIAGQVLRRGLTVVTADTADFGRVDGLLREDWTR